MCFGPATQEQQNQRFMNTTGTLSGEDIAGTRQRAVDYYKDKHSAYAAEISKFSDADIVNWQKGTKEGDAFKYFDADRRSTLGKVYDSNVSANDLTAERDALKKVQTPDLADAALNAYARTQLLKNRNQSMGLRGAIGPLPSPAQTIQRLPGLSTRRLQ